MWTLKLHHLLSPLLLAVGGEDYVFQSCQLFPCKQLGVDDFRQGIMLGFKRLQSPIKFELPLGWTEVLELLPLCEYGCISTA